MNGDPAVVVVETDGADATALARALGDELGEVSVASLACVEQAPPGDEVVVLAAASPIGAPLCARVIAWADRRATRPGLIACVADGDLHDAEVALAAGLDDVVRGPPLARELVARVRAVDRRVRRAARIPERLRYGALVLATVEQVVWVDGVPHALSRGEFAVLRALIAAGGAAMSRSALLDAAWGPRKVGVGERAVDNVVVNLRRVVGAQRIVSVRRVGFRLAR